VASIEIPIHSAPEMCSSQIGVPLLSINGQINDGRIKLHQPEVANKPVALPPPPGAFPKRAKSHPNQAKVESGWKISLKIPINCRKKW
jgi:hypothetical protein